MSESNIPSDNSHPSVLFGMNTDIPAGHRAQAQAPAQQEQTQLRNSNTVTTNGVHPLPWSEIQRQEHRRTNDPDHIMISNGRHTDRRPFMDMIPPGLRTFMTSTAQPAQRSPHQRQEQQGARASDGTTLISGVNSDIRTPRPLLPVGLRSTAFFGLLTARDTPANWQEQRAVRTVSNIVSNDTATRDTVETVSPVDSAVPSVSSSSYVIDQSAAQDPSMNLSSVSRPPQAGGVPQDASESQVDSASNNNSGRPAEQQAQTPESGAANTAPHATAAALADLTVSAERPLPSDNSLVAQAPATTSTAVISPVPIQQSEIVIPQIPFEGLSSGGIASSRNPNINSSLGDAPPPAYTRTPGRLPPIQRRGQPLDGNRSQALRLESEVRRVITVLCELEHDMTGLETGRLGMILERWAAIQLTVICDQHVHDTRRLETTRRIWLELEGLRDRVEARKQANTANRRLLCLWVIAIVAVLVVIGIGVLLDGIGWNELSILARWMMNCSRIVVGSVGFCCFVAYGIERYLI